MSHRIDEKQARREARLAAEAAERRLQRRHALMRKAGYGAIAAIAAILITLAATLGGTTPAPSAPQKAATASGGFEPGATAPDFALKDAVSGQTVSAKSLRGQKTMLFFSEGINCQACMVQAADLQKSGTLERKGIRLVSVTNDQEADLAQAAAQYAITTPLLADPTTEMTAQYGMLGHGGMGHPQVAGHAFMLLDEQGKVQWHRAYQEMYVETADLLNDMKEETKA